MPQIAPSARAACPGDNGRGKANLAPRARRCLVATAACVAAIAIAAPAWARSEKTLAYPREQVWPTAVRFLAVDERVKVTEKDAEAGYLMFELRDDGKTFRGSLEVMTIVRDGRSLVRFVLQIQDRPSWLELAMLERLERKLRAELGSPAPPPSKPPPAPPRSDDGKPDGNADGKPDGKPDERPGDGPPVSPVP
jgi:hypothetical protein